MTPSRKRSSQPRVRENAVSAPASSAGDFPKQSVLVLEDPVLEVDKRKLAGVDFLRFILETFQSSGWPRVGGTCIRSRRHGMGTPLSRFMILLSALLLLTLASFAQFSQRGSIGGVVIEASGAVVPKASVKLLDLDRNQTSTVITDANGHYEFSQLLPGDYQVTVEVAEFKKSVSGRLPVSPQSEVRCDIQLQLATASETITVTGSS